MLQHRANITGRQPIIISLLCPGCGSASGDNFAFCLRVSKKLPPPHWLVCAHAIVASSCLMPPTRRCLGAIFDFRLPQSNMTNSRPFRRGTLVEILLLVESQAPESNSSSPVGGCDTSLHPTADLRGGRGAPSVSTVSPNTTSKSLSTFVDAALAQNERAKRLRIRLVLHRVPQHARPLRSRSLVDLLAISGA